MHDQGSLDFETAKQHFYVSQALLDLFSQERAELYGALPLFRRDNTLVIAISRHNDAELIAMIEEDLGLTIVPLFTEHYKIVEAMERFYNPEWKAKREHKAKIEKEIEAMRLALECVGEPSPIVKFYELVLFDAYKHGAERIVWKLQDNFGLHVLLTAEGEDREFIKPPRRLTHPILELVCKHANLPLAISATPQEGVTHYERGDVSIPAIKTVVDTSVFECAPKLPALTPKQEKELRELLHSQGKTHKSPSELLVASAILKSVLFFESCPVIFERTNATQARILFNPGFKLHIADTFPAGLFEPIYHHLLRACGAIQTPGLIARAVFRRLPEKPPFEYGEYRVPIMILGQVFKVHVRMFSMGDRQYIEINPPPPHRLWEAGVFDADDVGEWSFGDDEEPSDPYIHTVFNDPDDDS
jgi:hypothetical protein